VGGLEPPTTWLTAKEVTLNIAVCTEIKLVIRALPTELHPSFLNYVGKWIGGFFNFQFKVRSNLIRSRRFSFENLFLVW